MKHERILQFAGQFSGCGSNEFRCTNGDCIPSIDKCDGAVNCADDSDETFEICRYVACPTYGFRCDYGACVARSKRCDGRQDCYDGSDEKRCQTTTIDLRPLTLMPPDHSQGTFQGSQQSHSSFPTQSTFSTTARPQVSEPDQASEFDGDGACVIELPRRGDAFLEGTTEALRPLQTVASGRRVRYNCTDNFYVVAGSRENRCENGRWESAVAVCEARCSSISGVTVQVKCLSAAGGRPAEAECKDLSLPGTRAVVSCQTGYKRPVATQNLTCTDYGRWSNLPAKCTQICGTPSHSVNSSYSVWTGDISEVPWHVGIYKSREYQCGGTIISSKVVVSAAHCFWDISRETLRDVRDYRVRAGQTRRDTRALETRGVAAVGVERIIHDPQYSFAQNNNERDIAFVILAEHLAFDQHIAPACFYDLYEDQMALLANEDDFDSDAVGMVAGWGGSPRANFSETLKVMRLGKISRRSCIEKTPQNFHGFITSDKFCAGDAGSSTVCQGDSGGGFTSVQDGKHYLRGVVSIGSTLPCASTRYTTFTKVALYTKLIREYLIDFYLALL